MLAQPDTADAAAKLATSKMACHPKLARISTLRIEHPDALAQIGTSIGRAAQS